MKKSKHPIGSIVKFGERDYIKTANGWKYYGKGSGQKNQQHKTDSSDPSIEKTRHLLELQFQHVYTANQCTDINDCEYNISRVKQLIQYAEQHNLPVKLYYVRLRSLQSKHHKFVSRNFNKTLDQLANSFNKQLSKNGDIQELKRDIQDDTHSINLSVAHRFMSYVATMIGETPLETEYKNESKKSPTYFQLQTPLASGNILYTSPFVNVDSNHKVNSSGTKIELLNSDYETIRTIGVPDISKSQTSTKLTVKDKVVKGNYEGHYSNVLVIKEGKLLLLQRSHDDEIEPSKWCLPGGHIDKGESPLIAAKRELKEESNLVGKDLEYLGKIKCKNGKFAYYYITQPQGELALTDGESVNGIFYTEDQWKELDLLFDLKQHLIQLLEVDDIKPTNMNDFEKGGKSLPIGTERSFGGKPYVKTANGWRPKGKGGKQTTQQSNEKKQESPKNDWTKPSHLSEEDHSALRLIKEEYDKGDYRSAMKFAESVDTIVREEIPDFIWQKMGGKLSSSAERKVSQQKNEILQSFKNEYSKAKNKQSVIDKYMEMDGPHDSDDLNDIIDQLEEQNDNPVDQLKGYLPGKTVKQEGNKITITQDTTTVVNDTKTSLESMNAKEKDKSTRDTNHSLVVGKVKQIYGLKNPTTSSKTDYTQSDFSNGMSVDSRVHDGKITTIITLPKNMNKLEKGGKALPIGTERMFGGKPFIKTANGWKPKSKGKKEKVENSGARESSSKKFEDMSYDEHMNQADNTSNSPSVRDKHRKAAYAIESEKRQQKTTSSLKEKFIKQNPTAEVTEKKNSKGDTIVYVNGETAFNKQDTHNSSNWMNMMSDALKRSEKAKGSKNDSSGDGGKNVTSDEVVKSFKSILADYEKQDTPLPLKYNVNQIVRSLSQNEPLWYRAAFRLNDIQESIGKDGISREQYEQFINSVPKKVLNKLQEFDLGRHTDNMSELERYRSLDNKEGTSEYREDIEDMIQVMRKNIDRDLNKKRTATPQYIEYAKKAQLALDEFEKSLPSERTDSQTLRSFAEEFGIPKSEIEDEDFMESFDESMVDMFINDYAMDHSKGYKKAIEEYVRSKGKNFNSFMEKFSENEDFADHHRMEIDEIFTKNILAAFNELKKGMKKSLDPDLIKGGKALPIGTEKTWGGKTYIKTATGWKPKGKGKKPGQEEDKSQHNPKQQEQQKEGNQQQEEPKSNPHEVDLGDGQKGNIMSPPSKHLHLTPEQHQKMADAHQKASIAGDDAQRAYHKKAAQIHSALATPAESGTSNSQETGSNDTSKSPKERDELRKEEQKKGSGEGITDEDAIKSLENIKQIYEKKTLHFEHKNHIFTEAIRRAISEIKGDERWDPKDEFSWYKATEMFNSYIEHNLTYGNSTYGQITREEIDEFKSHFPKELTDKFEQFNLGRHGSGFLWANHDRRDLQYAIRQFNDPEQKDNPKKNQKNEKDLKKEIKDMNSRLKNMRDRINEDLKNASTISPQELTYAKKAQSVLDQFEKTIPKVEGLVEDKPTKKPPITVTLDDKKAFAEQFGIPTSEVEDEDFMEDFDRDTIDMFLNDYDMDHSEGYQAAIEQYVKSKGKDLDSFMSDFSEDEDFADKHRMGIDKIFSNNMLAAFKKMKKGTK